jgi:hypothetical protein
MIGWSHRASHRADHACHLTQSHMQYAALRRHVRALIMALKMACSKVFPQSPYSFHFLPPPAGVRSPRSLFPLAAQQWGGSLSWCQATAYQVRKHSR